MKYYNIQIQVDEERVAERGEPNTQAIKEAVAEAVDDCLELDRFDEVDVKFKLETITVPGGHKSRYNGMGEDRRFKRYNYQVRLNMGSHGPHYKTVFAIDSQEAGRIALNRWNKAISITVLKIVSRVSLHSDECDCHRVGCPGFTEKSSSWSFSSLIARFSK